MENKIAVIYKSKYGATKRYAGWILQMQIYKYQIVEERFKGL